MRTLSRIRIMVVLICVGCLLGSCGLSDWSYELLPGDYEIWRVNSHCIVLVRPVNTTDTTAVDTIVDAYVWAFCYDDTFIGIQRLPVQSEALDAQIDIRSLDTSNMEYYLVDATNNTVYGPYSAQAYEKQVALLTDGSLCDWIDTYPMPEGAT